MPSNCAIVGCKTSRKSAPHLIKVRGFKPEHSKVTGDRWIEVIKRHQVVDESLKNQIAKKKPWRL